MRPRISTRVYVHPSVHLLVRRSIRWSVTTYFQTVNLSKRSSVIIVDDSSQVSNDSPSLFLLVPLIFISLILFLPGHIVFRLVLVYWASVIESWLGCVDHFIPSTHTLISVSDLVVMQSTFTTYLWPQYCISWFPTETLLLVLLFLSLDMVIWASLYHLYYPFPRDWVSLFPKDTLMFQLVRLSPELVFLISHRNPFVWAIDKFA